MPQARAHLLDGSIKQEIETEGAPDFSLIARLSREPRKGVAGNQEHPSEAGKRCRDLFGQPSAKRARAEQAGDAIDPHASRDLGFERRHLASQAVKLAHQLHLPGFSEHPQAISASAGRCSRQGGVRFGTQNDNG